MSYPHYTTECLEVNAELRDRLEKAEARGCTIQEFQTENVLRSLESFPSSTQWTPLEWAGALAGEVGELANLLKKLRRGESVDPEAIRDEIGDVLAYLALVAESVDADLATCAVDKFNKVSRRVMNTRALKVGGGAK